MGKYATEWSATCPRCEKSITPEMFTCGTCGKGILKAEPYKTVLLGCDKCDTSHVFSISCPDCQTKIPEHFIKVSESAVKAEAKRVEGENRRAFRKGAVITWVGVIGVPILVVAPFAGLLPTLLIMGVLLLIAAFIALPQIMNFIFQSIVGLFRGRDEK